MKHFGYDWDLGPGYIIPDEELNTDKLGWKPGQFWQVQQAEDGKLSLHLVDPIVQFVLDKPGDNNE
jgi:hypothetical protein